MRKRFMAPGEKIHNFSTWQLIKEYWKLLKPYRGKFFVGSIFRLLSDIFNLYSTYALASIVTIIGQGNLQENADRLWTILVTWSVITVFRTVGIYVAKRILFGIANRVALDAEQMAFNHIFKLDIAWHEKENTGNKIKKISNAVDGYNRMMNIWANNIIEIVVNFIGSIVILSQFNQLVGLITLVFLFCYLLLAKVLLKYVGVAVHNTNVQSEELNGVEYEAMSNVRTVKIMGMLQPVYNRIHTSIDSYHGLVKTRIFWVMNRISSETLLAQVFKIGTLIFIMHSIINGHAEVGLLILFNNYFNNVWQSVDELSNVAQDVLVSRYSISRLKEDLDEPIRIDSDQGKSAFPKNWQEITLRDISFSYDSNPVLNNVSFSIKKGEKIGIVGLSGAGKSTLFKLLLKEYENFTGQILVGDTDIQQIKKSNYFNHVAVVLQDTEVFNLSLKSNISLMSPRPKESDLKKAVEISHVSNFLPRLSGGINTVIGEKGVRLSGGEKQRLGIARAVYKEPQILLMDEATSHLDLESEEKIQDSLHKFFKDVTAVVIAHRLTTIKEMDKILVIEEGKIIESGNFAELTQKRGRFFELWEKQKL